MDTTKIITLTIIGIIAMAISLTVTQLFLRSKIKIGKRGKNKSCLWHFISRLRHIFFIAQCEIHIHNERIY